MYKFKDYSIIYCYKRSLNRDLAKIPNIECHYELPDISTINKRTKRLNEKLLVLCFDDHMIDISQNSIMEGRTSNSYSASFEYMSDGYVTKYIPKG